jgi:hypothetical protein
MKDGTKNVIWILAGLLATFLIGLFAGKHFKGKSQEKETQKP